MTRGLSWAFVVGVVGLRFAVCNQKVYFAISLTEFAYWSSSLLRLGLENCLVLSITLTATTGTDGLTDSINSFGYIGQSQPETETCCRELWGRAIIGYQYITIYYTMRRAQSNFWLFLVRRDEPPPSSSSCLRQTTKTTANIAVPLPSFIFNKHGNGNMQSSQTDNKGQQTFLAAWTARSRSSPSLTKSPSRSKLVAGEKA